MIKRYTASGSSGSSGQDGDDPEKAAVEGARKIMSALIIAAIVMWVGPIALGLQADTGDTADTGECEGDDIDMVACMAETEKNVGRVMNSVLDIFKYILLAGAIGSIVFLRIRSPAALQ